MATPSTERPTPTEETSLDRVTVLLVDDDESWVRATARLLASNNDAFQVDTAHSLAEGRVAFAEDDPECVVCDYQLGDGTGLDLLATVREFDPDRPFVLVTGRGSESVASEAIGQGVTDYIRKDHDDAESDLLASRVENAVGNYRTERALERQHRSKNAMLEILTATTSETELHHQFCAQLVEDRGYACAWIGSEEGAGALVPEAVVGDEDYVDAAVAAEDAPAKRALRADEPITVTLADGETGEGWRARAIEHGFSGTIAAPIRHDGVRFGVLAVYADDPAMLEARERRAIGEYAGTIGYALRAAERKRSLMADAPVRIAVEVEDPSVPAVALWEALPASTGVEVSSAVPQESGSTLYAAYVEGTTVADVESAAADLDGLALVGAHEEGGPVSCELLADDPTPESVVASHGGRFETTTVEGGVATVSLTVPDDGTIQAIVDALEEVYDEANVTTVWTERDDQATALEGDPLAPLTDRQREVLQHAFHVGYFEQPRETSATELADTLDIARATMTQHLRTAQQKVFGEVLPGEDR